METLQAIHDAPWPEIENADVTVRVESGVREGVIVGRQTGWHILYDNKNADQFAEIRPDRIVIRTDDDSYLEVCTDAHSTNELLSFDADESIHQA